MSSSLAAFLVLGLTISLSLARPRFGSLHVHHSYAAVIGASLVLALQLLPPAEAFQALELLSLPVITIVSLMIITIVAEQAGLFQILAGGIARAAAGDGRRLFAYLYFTGTLTGMMFTNDAAVLIFTPLVINLIEEVKEDSWTMRQKIPYYFSVLYIANLVGGLVISNPINIIVASIFQIGFLEYAVWMGLPAVVSIVVSYLGIRFVFRKSIPDTYRVPQRARTDPKSLRFLGVCALVLAVVLVGFFSETFTGVPVWAVALGGAVQLLLLRSAMTDIQLKPIIKGVGWDVIVFVVGIFLVARAISHVGLTEDISELLIGLAGTDLMPLTVLTGFAAAVSSAFINNHPTADIMSWVIRDMSMSDFDTKMLAFAALIGGDLGPKMLPIGSLAALLWFGILRSRGIYVSYWLYIQIGIPVTLAALALSLLMLNLQLLIYEGLR